MATARQMATRTWELYSQDIIFYGGAILLVICFVVSPILGAVAGYFFCVLANGMVWSKELAPFSWVESDRAGWILVLLGPVTTVGILIGMLICVMFAPFFLRKSIRKRKLKSGEPTTFNNRNWVIGIGVYYLVLTGLAALAVNGIQS